MAARNVLRESMESFRPGFGPDGREIMGGIPHFTGIPATGRFSEVVA